MFRRVSQQLKSLHDGGSTSPIWLLGLKGTGKTYAAFEFAEEYFEDKVYLNFENDGRLRVLFESMSAEGAGFLDCLNTFLAADGSLPRNVLYIIDEIGACGAALTSFLRMISEYDVSGYSFLIISSTDITPVIGHRENILHVSPMTFDEFLNAGGHGWYSDVIRAHSEGIKRIPDLIFGELSDLFRDYLEVGGMPQSVASYLGSHAYDDCTEINRRIMGSYRNDILAAGAADTERSLRILDEIPGQLTGGIRRFRVNSVRKGMTVKMCSNAISNLTSGYGIICLDRSKALEDSGVEADEGSFALLNTDHGATHMQLVASGSDETDVMRATLINAFVSGLYAMGWQVSFIESKYVNECFFTFSKGGRVIKAVLRFPGSRKKNRVIFPSQNGKECSPDIVFDEYNLRYEDDVICAPYFSSEHILNVILQK